MIATSEKRMSENEKRVINAVINPILRKCLMYGRLTWVKSLCTPGFTAAKAKELSEDGLREKLEETLNLYPFLTLLVEKMKGALEIDFDVWSEEVVNADWLGRQDLLAVRLTGSELNSRISENRPDDRAVGFSVYTKPLDGLSIVAQHIGVVALEVARVWLDSKQEIRSKVEGYSNLINLMVDNLNRCSVRTIEVKEVDGEYSYTSTKFYFDEEDCLFKLSEETTKLSDEVADSFIVGWEHRVGLYTLHKYLVVEEVTQTQGDLLNAYRDIQLPILNEFVNKP